MKMINSSSERIRSDSLEMEIINLSKDWIRVRVKNRGYEPNKRLCIEIRKMLNEPIIVTKRILFLKRRVKVYDLTVGCYSMDGIKPFSEKEITIRLEEPIDLEENYSIALLECGKENTLLIRLFDPKEFLRGSNKSIKP